MLCLDAIDAIIRVALIMAFSIELGAGGIFYCIMSGDAARHYSVT